MIAPLLTDGMPMLAGAVAFETIRNADRIVIGSMLGFAALGVYSVTQLVCQGVYYLPNALSTVMYPRFQERFGAHGDCSRCGSSSRSRCTSSATRCLRGRWC